MPIMMSSLFNSGLLVEASLSFSWLSESVIVAVLSSVGGILVLKGLCMEEGKEKEMFSDLADKRRRESRAKLGAKYVIAGVLIETLIGGGLAAYDGIENWNNNPINQPIKYVHANVFLVIEHEAFTTGPLSKQPPLLSAFFDIRRKSDFGNLREDPLAILDCTKLEIGSMFIPQGNILDPSHPGIDAQTFSLTFEWPGSEFSDVILSGTNKLWLDKNNASIGQFDKQDVYGRIFLSGVDSGWKILSGSCVLLINGSIQRRFAVSKVTNAGEVLCFPLSAPSK